MALIKCKECGKQISDNSNTCIHCDCPIEVKNNHSEKSNTNNTYCLVGFIVALISLILNLWGIVGIIAVIFSVMGLNKINQTKENGKGMAIAGICIGVFSILYATIQLLALML